MIELPVWVAKVLFAVWFAIATIIFLGTAKTNDPWIDMLLTAIFGLASSGLVVILTSAIMYGFYWVIFL